MPSLPPIGPLLAPPPQVGVKVAAVSNDPAQKVRMLPGSSLFNVRGLAKKSSTLTVTLDGVKVAVPLAPNQPPSATLAALKAALPPGYEAVGVLLGKPGQAENMNVRITRRLASVAAPAVELMLANDPKQRVRVPDGKKLVISGIATNNGFVPSMVNLRIDGRPVSVSIDGGDSPAKTARAILAALPEGYRGQVETDDVMATVVVHRSR
jgi:hypothetical protein